MSRSCSWGMASAIAIACAASATAAESNSEPIEIPLKEIWALDMPGTRNIRELEPKRENESQLSKEERIRGSLVEHTRWSLNSNFKPSYGNAAERGFVVVGTGLDALREAHAVLTKEQERTDFLPADKDLTLVFYSYEGGRDLQLDEVVRQGDTVTVKYHFDTDRRLTTSTHFALIPLGELQAGKVRVRIKRLPDTGIAARPIDPVNVRRIVCDSFSFGVENEKN